MKMHVAWTMILWFALIAEDSRPDVLPSCSLTVPLAVGCIFWLRTGSSIMIAGTSLLVGWLLHPSLLPIEVASSLVGAAGFLSPQKSNRDWPSAISHGRHSISWLPFVMVTLFALCSRAFVEANLLPNVALSLMWTRLPVAAVCTITIIFTRRIADEFGLTRQTAHA
jgi:hypothetical protein